MSGCVMGAVEASILLYRGEVVRLAPPMQTTFRLRCSKLEIWEVWKRDPDSAWVKYGSVFKFRNTEAEQMFTRASLGTLFANA